MLLFGLTAVQAQIVTSSADDGDIINFALGVDDIVLIGGPIVINNSITITGNLVTNTIVHKNDNGRIFDITAGDVIINDLEITNGTAVDGGAILISNATLVINGSTVISEL